MTTVTSLVIPDMHCEACASRIQRALADLANVGKSRINTARQRLYVEHDDRINPLMIIEALEAVGFHPTLGPTAHTSATDRTLLKRLGVAGLAAMQVMTIAVALYIGEASGMAHAYRELLRFAALLFTLPVVLYAARPFFLGAWRSLRGGGLSMDVPVALALAIAFATSAAATVSGSGEVYYDSVAMFTFLLLAARFLDSRLRGRLDAGASVLQALPTRCSRLVDGNLEDVDLNDIRVTDVLWITPDNRVPADGVIDSGCAWLDESLLTGESDPVEKRAGERVFAGTLVKDAGLQMVVEASGGDTRLAAIDAIARRAELSKPRVASLTDRVARIFIASILSVAAATYLAWLAIDPQRALPAALAVLVISCPCALSLAVPAAITAALARIRALGGVAFNSESLTRLARVDEMLIDKTGTLTTGTPTIDSIHVLFGSPDRHLAVARALQRHSSHPLARAFNGATDVEVEAVHNVPGSGVEGTWNGKQVRLGSAEFCGANDSSAAKSVFLSLDGDPVARFDIAEQLRRDAVTALAELSTLGVQTRIVSGDAEAACARVAAALDVPYAHSQTPEAKLAAVAEAQRNGHTVLAIGDGINDVPLLAAADVSIAVLETPDVVREHTDVLLLSRNLGAIPKLLVTARRCSRAIRQNLTWAVLYNVLAIPLAALGLVPPWLAAVGMSASSLVVMVNASRVLKPVPASSERQAVAAAPSIERQRQASAASAQPRSG